MLLNQFTSCNPRDGRLLRLEAKPKSQMCLDRFPEQGRRIGGGDARAMPAQHGLERGAPSPLQQEGTTCTVAVSSYVLVKSCGTPTRRTIADFYFRYIRKASELLAQARIAAVSIQTHTHTHAQTGTTMGERGQPRLRHAHPLNPLSPKPQINPESSKAY